MSPRPVPADGRAARVAGAAAGLLLVAAAASACGGLPEDANGFEFCQAVKLDKKGFVPGEWDTAEDMAEKLKEVGTPEDIPDDAREGAELIVDLVEDSSDIREFTGKAMDLDSDDQDRLLAYLEYVKDTCG
jgi:ABC-type sugar transport system substrate-binding protein